MILLLLLLSKMNKGLIPHFTHYDAYKLMIKFQECSKFCFEVLFVLIHIYGYTSCHELMEWESLYRSVCFINTRTISMM